jgi:hypothetical protein
MLLHSAGSLPDETACRKALDHCLESGIYSAILTNGGEPAYVGTPEGHLAAPAAEDRSG